MRNKRYLTLLCILFASSHAAAQADPSTEIAAIRAEIGRLAERLDRLEQAQGSEPAPRARPRRRQVAAGDSHSPSALLRRSALSPRGDRRGSGRRASPRAESAHVTGRRRTLGNDLVVGLGLATGDHDPISANQTLDGGFDRDSVRRRPRVLHLARDGRAERHGRQNEESVLSARRSSPDLRLRPEPRRARAELQHRALVRELCGLLGRGAQRGGRLDAVRRSVRVSACSTRGAKLTAGMSYYDYRRTQGRAPVLRRRRGRQPARCGRSVRERLQRSGAVRGARLDRRQAAADAVRGLRREHRSRRRGQRLGARREPRRSGRSPGTWSVGYAYQELGADAVIGTFTDSDFGGRRDGQSRARREFEYGLREHWLFGLRYYSNRRGADAGNERDYEGLQADVMFEY